MSQRIEIYQDILAANDRIAAENRALLRAHGIFSLNIIGSPGCGKTALLEATICWLRKVSDLRVGVIEGDLATRRDAERIAALDVPVTQINTGGGCHLDAPMVQRALGELPLDAIDLIFIENVGNLVCPAEFDLGEDGKIAVLSVAEGHDKPEKYPIIFRNAMAVVISKADLLPHVDFDLARAQQELRHIHAEAPQFLLSARTKEGMEEWANWVRRAATEGVRGNA